jgi:PAS domain-containing protein
MSKDLEVTLLEADRRAQRLIDTAADGFVGMDAFGVVTDWNRSVWLHQGRGDWPKGQ